MVAAYEDIRIAPKENLAQELMQGSLEEVMYSVVSSCNNLGQATDNHVTHVTSESRRMFDDAELNEFMKISSSDGPGDEELPNICRPSSMLASNKSKTSLHDEGENTTQNMAFKHESRNFWTKRRFYMLCFPISVRLKQLEVRYKWRLYGW